MKTKQEKKYLQVFIEDVVGKMVAVATDETIDRQGDKLDITKWDLKNFKKNPVLQAGHDYMPQNTIGIAKNIRVEAKRLLFEPVFHEITQTAREIKKMFEEGILKTFSVGFLTHYKRDKEGRVMTEGGWPVIDRYELLEISAVPVPANPSAEIVQLSIDKAKQATIEEVEKIKGFIDAEVERPAPAKKAVIDSLLYYSQHTSAYYKGKTLSETNQNKILNIIADLQALMPVKSGESAKGRTLKVVEEKTSNNYDEEVVLRALQNVAKNINFALNKVKNK